VAAQALRSLGIDLDEVRRLVSEIGDRGRPAPSGHLPLGPEAKKALDLALREALQLGRPVVATEHILLGLIRNGEGVAAQVLLELGANLDEIRRQALPLTETEPFPTAHLGELQRAKDAAIDAGDFRQAAILRAQERELPAPDPGGETARLRQEVDRLRALLQDAGIDPEAGTPRTA
jgi:ATP-dependent Clp protease ATP-binding subunit ClpA